MCFLCTRYCLKHCIHTISFEPLNNEKILSLSLFYRWRNWDLKLNNLPKIMCLPSGQNWVQSWVVCLQSLPLTLYSLSDNTHTHTHTHSTFSLAFYTFIEYCTSTLSMLKTPLLACPEVAKPVPTFLGIQKQPWRMAEPLESGPDTRGSHSCSKMYWLCDHGQMT